MRGEGSTRSLAQCRCVQRCSHSELLWLTQQLQQRTQRKLLHFRVRRVRAESRDEPLHPPCSLPYQLCMQKL
jgi:hypothetical protein